MQRHTTIVSFCLKLKHIFGNKVRDVFLIRLILYTILNLLIYNLPNKFSNVRQANTDLIARIASIVNPFFTNKEATSKNLSPLSIRHILWIYPVFLFYTRDLNDRCFPAFMILLIQTTCMICKLCRKTTAGVLLLSALFYICSWQVRAITSICCSLVRSMNLTA